MGSDARGLTWGRLQKIMRKNKAKKDAPVYINFAGKKYRIMDWYFFPNKTPREFDQFTLEAAEPVNIDKAEHFEKTRDCGHFKKSEVGNGLKYIERLRQDLPK